MVKNTTGRMITFCGIRLYSNRRCERCSKRNVAKFEFEQTRTGENRTYIVLGNAFPVRCIAEEVCPRDIL